jgi:hypothetical protein
MTLPPERAARLIVRGLLRGQDRVLIGTDALYIDAVSRILGPGAARFITRRASARMRASAATAGNASVRPSAAATGDAPGSSEPAAIG